MSTNVTDYSCNSCAIRVLVSHFWHFRPQSANYIYITQAKKGVKPLNKILAIQRIGLLLNVYLLF